MLSNARTDTVASVRARVTGATTTKLTDAEAIAIAFAASTRYADEIIGFLLPTHLHREATRQRDTLQLTNEEFALLFGASATSALRFVDGAARVAVTPHFTSLRKRAETSLRQTLAEPSQIILWSRPQVQLLAALCFHLHETHDMLATVLGGMIQADGRRVEELVGELEDDEPDIMAISAALIAIGELA